MKMKSMSKKRLDTRKSSVKRGLYGSSSKGAPRLVRVILASASPRRKQFLEELGICFDVREPAIDESPGSMRGASRIVMKLARQKAETCIAPNALVIGMDTLVFVGNERLEKPANQAEARQMLQSLSGRSHRVVTGVALFFNGKWAVDSETTRVYFRKLTRAEIDWYVQTGEPFDKAGGYAIQGFARLFISRIDGCYFNVVGFPVQCFLRLLDRLGLNIYSMMNDEF